MHRGKKRVKLIFDFDPVIMNFLETMEGVAWSSTMSCWHIPFADNYLNNIKNVFGNYAQVVDMSNKYEDAKKKDLRIGNQQALANFYRFLKNRRYSEQTIKNYMKRVRDFLEFFNDKDVELITNEDVQYYNYVRMVKRRSSNVLQNQFVTALTHFLTTIRESRIDIDKVERARKKRRLPTVFSKSEIERILNCTQNQKHKTMLLLTYACGLRRNEIGKLQITDIIADRKLLAVRKAKGLKDRFVPISEKTIQILRDYYKLYRPKIYIFETSSGNAYNPETVYKIFKRALERSGIKKKVGIHTLRHSYATHLLESGTDLRYIQTILGHKSSKTTEIYTHVSNQSISNITSPADELFI